MPEIECLVEARFGVGESPLWDAGNNRLLWTDNTTGDVHGLDLATRERRLWRFDGLLGSLGLARSGRWVVAVDDRVELFDPESGAAELLARIPLPPGVEKLNDGKVGPDGAFWVGSLARREPERRPVAGLYRVTPAGGVEQKIDGGVMVSNGLAWSADGQTMYHSDSRGGWIDVWDFDAATGGIANRRRLAEGRPGEFTPDGAATDVEGGYWSAGFAARRLTRIAPDGSVIKEVPVPAAVTMPCFGGPDMKTLFVTSLTVHATPEALAACPLTGSVFTMRAAVAGVPVGLFAD